MVTKKLFQLGAIRLILKNRFKIIFENQTVSLGDFDNYYQEAASRAKNCIKVTNLIFH